ncbi:hypothetical protein NVS89_03130 [Ancylobacter sp. MQZ15Z-1]|uniref:Uncharacterized protein n=1 Tax=Ancylobacter mangrovi TaxID=2972472 RepID=A0A9X2T2Q6_9HYPH|nr:hypothetical protein [Ancylobacter mangrovi]MCS0494076.1 hypothetical protein [Ancylobacter mangrovi]
MPVRAVAEPTVGKLRAEDFSELEIPYLNPSIRTSQSMAWFADRVILGTGRSPLGFLGRFTGQESPRRGAHTSTGGSDQDGAQILSFDPVSEVWTKIYDSPVLPGKDGTPRARDRSIRASLVCQTLADDAPTLYLGAGSLEAQVTFLRSEDGQTIEECGGAGFNLDADVPSARAMACLHGRLFCTPTGRNYGRGMYDDNITDFPIVFTATDPRSGNWVAASEPGFGEAENLSINELAVFEDHLYAATLNPRFGFQLWKTDARGEPPFKWYKIIDRGAWLGSTNSIPAAVKVFKGALYVTATVQRQGRSSLDNYGPFPAEMIRVYANDDWDLVSGTARFTPNGVKRPVSGLTGGFGDRYTHAFWRTAIHDGDLVVGTAGWRWMPTYLRNRDELSDAQYRRLCEDADKYRAGEFKLWRSPDGETWELITEHGFPGSSPNNYGVRELLPTPHGLFVAPTAMVGAVGGGGLELWWGRK